MNKTKAKKGVYTLYVELSERDRARLEAIRAHYEAVSVSDAARTAIRLTEAAIAALKAS
jgi:hypothetical protein